MHCYKLFRCYEDANSYKSPVKISIKFVHPKDISPRSETSPPMAFRPSPKSPRHFAPCHETNRPEFMQFKKKKTSIDA